MDQRVPERRSVGGSDSPQQRGPPVLPGVVTVLTVACLVLLGVGAATAMPATSDATVTGPAALQAGPNATLAVSPTPAETGGTVTFDARNSSGSTDDPIVQCAFDVDGDGEVEATREECLYEQVFDSPAEYEARVTVTTESGATATDTGAVSIQDSVGPRARITVDLTAPRVGESVELSGSDSSDPDGTLVEYRWRIDGETAEGERLTRQFDAADVYELSLTVTDENGETNTTDRTLEVSENRPPSAALSVRPSAPAVGETVVLDASESTDPDGPIERYRWDLDGDGAVDRESPEPSIETTVEGTGDLEVAVSVVDDLGAVDRATSVIEVQTATPTEPSTAAGSPDGGGTVVPTATAIQNPAVTGPDGLGFVDSLDVGLVPLVPDWLVVLLAVLAGTAIAAHRRETLRSKASEYRERVHTGEFRKTMSKKGVAFVAKSIVKRGFRRAGDLVEFVTEATGEAFERIGRAIKHAGQRVATFLRKLGG